MRAPLEQCLSGRSTTVRRSSEGTAANPQALTLEPQESVGESVGDGIYGGRGVRILPAGQPRRDQYIVLFDSWHRVVENRARRIPQRLRPQPDDYVDI